MAKKTNKRVVSPTDGQIGLRMRHMRTAKGISQGVIGDHLGISFQQIQKYEKGVNRLSLTRAIEVAKFLGTTVDELIGLDGETVTTTEFDFQTYRLSQSLIRLDGLIPNIASLFRGVIDTVCDEFEKNGRKKKKP